jgi:ubiquinone/menaquinone biosynthesis C-methylase UbiE
MIAWASKKSERENLKIFSQKEDITNLSFPDSYFDLVTITLVLHEIRKEKIDNNDF